MKSWRLDKVTAPLPPELSKLYHDAAAELPWQVSQDGWAFVMCEDYTALPKHSKQLLDKLSGVPGRLGLMPVPLKGEDMQVLATMALDPALETVINEVKHFHPPAMAAHLHDHETRSHTLHPKFSSHRRDDDDMGGPAGR